MGFIWLAAGIALAAPGASPGPDPSFCDPGAPKRCAQPLQQGQVAPYAGQLLTPELAADLGVKADGCDGRIAQEVDFTKRVAAIDLNLAQQLRAIDKIACDHAVSILTRAHEAAIEPPPIYERPWFVASVTFILTVAAGSLAVRGASQLAK